MELFCAELPNLLRVDNSVQLDLCKSETYKIAHCYALIECIWKLLKPVASINDNEGSR